MKKLTFYSITLLFIFFFLILGGCYSKDKNSQSLPECKLLCKNIPFSENAPPITEQEINQGWYYGQLDQKKPGTPETWIHKGEGTRSAMWFAPSNEDLEFCDCKR